MEELREEHRVVLVCGVRETPVIGDRLVAVELDGVAHEGGARVYRGHFDDDEPGASRRPRPMVRDERVVDPGRIDDARLVTGTHDPVP